MKPHLHSCPTCRKTWDCRGLLCQDKWEEECPECGGDFEIGDDEDRDGAA